ncbi:MAG: two-component response regulator [Firmicutes bacterium]|nr:two-component response regulator [Bacillota bacterium]
MDGVERRAGLRTTLETEGDSDRLPPSVEAGLLRIAQEALHNTVKHGQASHVMVRLVLHGPVAELAITDDGVGFALAGGPAPTASGGGFGLGGMAERARLLGGQLLVDAAPGAKGYLLKDAPPEELLQGIEAVAAGRSLLPPHIASKLMNVISHGGPARAEPAEQPTERELEILRHMARGAANKEIAAALYISENTVKTHVSNLFQKLGVRDRTEAVTKALGRGLITL